MSPNVLLLQGPIGPFFSRFGRDMEKNGFKVHKVNLNGGDCFFYRGGNTIDYTGKLKDWAAFLERLVENKEIGRIYLFGDCRAYHRIAKEVAKKNNIRTFVFEEGYIRPNFLTLEEGGVNGNSPMMSKQLNFKNISDIPEESVQHPHNVFVRTAGYSVLYYIAAAARRWRFPFYQHHRRFKAISEGYRWIVSAIRKWRFGFKERNFISELHSQYENNYFVCPLQVHCDMQVSVHSEYNSIEHFIGDVMKSFARKAPSNKALVFKHHPLDRGYTDYTLLLSNLISEYGLQGRVFYVHDVCLPSLLKSAQGTVLINSTVGMSSLFHGTPVKTMGRAVYDIPGLTSQKSLDAFWKRSGEVRNKAYERFKKYLITHNQVNGSLYKQLPDAANSSGLIWSEYLKLEHTYRTDQIELPSTPQLKIVGGLDVNRATNDSSVDMDGKNAA